MMNRQAMAIWHGGVMHGRGEVKTQSLALNGTEYSLASRLGHGIGTNPEELIGAAIAECFSMALAFELETRNFKVDEIKTVATVTMEYLPAGWTITAIRLDLNAKIPEIESKEFNELAEHAKRTCPISRLLLTKISLNASLNSASIGQELQQ